MKNLRTLVIIIGIGLIFVAVAVLAIIIVRGEKLTGEGFVKTGIIEISSKPVDVTVLVDGKEVKPTNNQITNLEPGDYDIVITKDGYTKWEKTVEARQGVVIEIFAQLFPLEQNLTAVTKTNIDRAFYSENGEHAIYTVKTSAIGTDIGLWRARLTQPTFSIVDTKPVKLSNMNDQLKSILDSNYNIEFSADLRLILLQNKDTKEYFVLDASSYNEPNKSLNAELGYTPDYVSWFKDSSSLIIQKDDLVFEYALDSKTSTVISLTPGQKPVFAVNADRVIFYNSNKKQLEVYERGKSDKLIVQNITLPTEITGVYLTKKDHKFVLLETATDLYYLNTEKSFLDKVAEGVRVISFAPDGQSVLYSQEGKLYSYTVEEIISENRIIPRINLINSTFSEDYQVKWSTDSSHIIELNSKDKEIKIYDKDGANMTTLLKDARIANFDINIPQSSTSMFLLMNDEVKQNETDVVRTNIFEMKLSK